MIHLNKHPAGKAFNVLFGLASVLDGLSRVVSLGFLFSSFPLAVTRVQSQYLLNKMKSKYQQQLNKERV